MEVDLISDDNALTWVEDEIKMKNKPNPWLKLKKGFNFTCYFTIVWNVQISSCKLNFFL